jgi:N-acetyl-alpha-D-glucosaminyl L-malate synthase BshA
MDGLRIAVSCHPTIGGSGIIATELGVAMARRGHDVHFVCADLPAQLAPSLGEPRIRYHRVAVPEYPLPNLGLYPLALASRLAALCEEVSLDLIHVHYAVPHAVSALLCRQLLVAQGRRPPRLVTTLHGTDVTQLGSAPELVAVNRHALLGCDGLTVPSEFLRRAAHERLGLPAETPIEVLPNFVDTERFRPLPERQPPERLRSDRPFILCHSSNFRPLKRIDHVIDILAHVNQHVCAQLVLLGDGPERPRIEALSEQRGLRHRVRFCGLLQDVAAVLRRSDVFLLPSETEGFGLAALEAQSCGVPVVASRVGGLPEVVRDGATGFLCEPDDVDGMAAAVLRLLQDPQLLARMSEAAREDALTRFREAPRVAAYEEYYRRLVGS